LKQDDVGDKTSSINKIELGAAFSLPNISVEMVSAAAFYRHFGFIELSGKPDRLLLPVAAFCQ
jgi:hypothetical protein